MHKNAPIVLFVYNRPEHTLKTLEALSNNIGASNSKLYIYADGIKANASNEDLAAVKETREVIRKQSWCGEVIIIESEVNKGLAYSIVKGVTEVINQHDKVIVLEDDIVTSKTFLNYMNEALNRYADYKRVYHINGYNNHSNLQFMLDEFYFLRFMSCWGWATWKDRWSNMNYDHKYYYDKLNSNDSHMSKFNYNGSLNFHRQLEDNITGTRSTWAILWYSTVFFNCGLCLTPKHSLVENIGLDGTGTNCTAGDFTQSSLSISKTSLADYNPSIKETYLSRIHLQLFYKYGSTFKFKNFIKLLLKKMTQ